jgi:succinyl-CoA synthetase beta subunit
MKLYESDAKEIFSKYGIPVPKGAVFSDHGIAGEFAGKFDKTVIKAQVLTGGRGKAGGVRIAQNPAEAKQFTQQILGMSIKGNIVRKVLVEEYRKPEKEMYLGITIDRNTRSPVIIASSEGGVDIEETARKTPDKIHREHINPLTGVHQYQSMALARILDRDNTGSISKIIQELYTVFVEKDCTLAEINPLAITNDGIFALDAKMVIDDNALFRQEFIEDESGSPESEARKHGMSYVGLDGDIGCIVNGAGLAMAIIDMINYYGGKAANFMDVRAGANAEQVRTALGIVSSNRNVKAIVVDIFGGITKCDEVAQGIVDVVAGIGVPLVVRLTGTNETEGRALLEKHGIIMASSTEEAAKAVVGLVHSNK